MLLAAVQFVSAPVAFSAKDELQPEQINNAIEQAKKWLIRQQSPNGTWKSAMRTDETVVGATALVVLASAALGVCVPHARPRQRQRLACDEHSLLHHLLRVDSHERLHHDLSDVRVHRV